MLNNDEMTAHDNSVPIFLRKTYTMIDTCDPSIANWSPDGLSFVVRNVEEFTSKTLGQFFKHKNLSSFIRQLNFYGFRKIKYVPLPFSAPNNVESKHLKFRHEKFQRGFPELMKEIRQPKRFEAAEKLEVNRLQGEVSELKAAITTMSNNISKLSSLVDKLVNNQHEMCHTCVPSDDSSTSDVIAATTGGKRNRITSEPNVVASSSSHTMSLYIDNNQVSAPVTKKQKVIPMAEHHTAAAAVFPRYVADDGHLLKSSSFGYSSSDRPLHEEMVKKADHNECCDIISAMPLESFTAVDYEEILTCLFEGELLESLE